MKKDLNPYFDNWSSLFERWEDWNEKNHLTKLETCLKNMFLCLRKLINILLV